MKGGVAVKWQIPSSPTNHTIKSHHTPEEYIIEMKEYGMAFPKHTMSQSQRTGVRWFTRHPMKEP